MLTYKSHHNIKKKQNRSLCQLVDENITSDKSKIKALIIDTVKGYTVDELVKNGITDITVVNYDSDQLDPLMDKYPFITTFTGSFFDLTNFYIINSDDDKFNLVYYDSCNTLATSYKSFFNLFAKNIISKNAVFVVTLCSRERKVIIPGRLKIPYRIRQWRTYPEKETMASYNTDQLIQDYAFRFGYTIYRMNDESKVKKNIFQIQYVLEEK